MKVGVLALQGCVEPHEDILRSVGAEAVRVRSEPELEDVEALILPGGESTTMLRLMRLSGLFEPLREFAKDKPTWGICAGAILLAERVLHPSQESLAAIPIEAHRNYYGSQLDSFSAPLEVPALGRTCDVDFIRAPRLLAMSNDVQVLAVHNEEQVLLQRNNILVASFHVELSGETWLHEYFVTKMISETRR